ncbi:MAG: TIGR03905 family TSCPD domain-containing protein [Bacteroidales bacterium]|nr:TIGR03905 family TSCPD domain-containing protein [Bacteroidales bacterium]MBO4565853.1 TIGR03905 family TSCPD domain-containing protein [Bacteroidales bacterium]
MGEDFRILVDTVENGVRHVTAAPSSLVCSKLIDFDLVDGKIHNLRYLGGCNGNLQALGALLEGADTGFALERLSGINCSGRGTSCSDQFARVLRTVLSKPVTK